MTSRKPDAVSFRVVVTFFIICACVNILAVNGFAAVNRVDFPFCRSIFASGYGLAELGLLRLDTALLDQLDASLANMRIFDSTGREIPFATFAAITPGDSEIVEIETDLEPIGFKDLGHDRIAMLFERKPGGLIPHRLCIQTSATDFEKRINVLGKNVDLAWDTLAAGQIIFDQSRYMNLRNTCVDFEAKDYKTYRIEIDRVTEHDRSVTRQIERIETHSGVEVRESYRETPIALTIDAVQFFAQSRTPGIDQPVVIDYSQAFGHRKGDTARQTSIFLIASSREPLTSLTFSFVERSFIRSATLEATDNASDSASWIDLCRTTIHTIAIGSIRDSGTTIRFPAEMRFSRYRLTIEDKDSPPLTLVAVIGHGPLYEARFLTQGFRTATLYYGANSISAARYDLSSVLERSGPLTTTQWQAGPIKHNPLFKPAKPIVKNCPEIDTHLLFLLSVILMVVVLAVVLIRAIRKIEKE